MRGFLVTNNDDNDWRERSFHSAQEVVAFLRKGRNEGGFGGRFTVYWKTPVTGDYVMLVDSNFDEVTFNTTFKVPRRFYDLVGIVASFKHYYQVVGGKIKEVQA